MEQRRIGRYQVLDEIASGGQGSVYRVFDPETGQIVALKVLHPNLVGDASYVERFHREARLAASISHPNVIRIFEVGQDEESYFISMEFLPESLARVLQSGGPMQIERAAQFAAQIAHGLGAAHALGIVHRDIKPQNVLVGVDGTAKVTDFGIARADILTTMTATGAMMGTPHYMSPEQARGEHAEVPSDVYSLGCVLYQMLTGELPFKGDTPLAIVRQQIDEEPTPQRKLRREMPRELADIVERAMAKDAPKRFQNGAEMASALRDAVPGIAEPTVFVTPTDPTVATAPPAPAPAVERHPRRARRALFTVAIGIVIAVVVAAVAALPLLLGPTPLEEPQVAVALPQREPEAAIATAAPTAPEVAVEKPVRPPVVIVPIAPEDPATLVSPRGDVTVELEAGSVDSAVNLEYTELTPQEAPAMPAGFVVSETVFDLSPSSRVGRVPRAFSKPITITIQLSAADVETARIWASSIVVRHIHGNDATWNALATTVDLDAMTAQAQVSELSCWQSAQVGQIRTREDYYYEELRGSSLRVLL